MAQKLQNVIVENQPKHTRWNICCKDGLISSISPSEIGNGSIAGLVTPSFCHPHVHLDKCFLLSHPNFEDLQIVEGTFTEALELTNKAKARFTHDDLIERGTTLIEESIQCGVSHMRAFVEVDSTVQLRCLAAGLELKKKFLGRCSVQICVFAQDPIFSYEDGGTEMRHLLEEAVQTEGVEAFGSTPYVEASDDPENQVRNIKYAVRLAQKYNLHLDFHIDYNLDLKNQVFVLEALNILNSSKWPCDKTSSEFRTIVFGHCTRLTLLNSTEWRHIAREIGDLPVHFIGLPTSDVYVMGKPDPSAGGGERARGTLQIPQMIKTYGLNAAIGINNVGNAFTPHGTCDPLRLASFCVGLYQAGTMQDTSTLLECVSSRAKAAIGIQSTLGSELLLNAPANFVLFNSGRLSEGFPHSTDHSVQQLIYTGGPWHRKTYYAGQITSER